MNRVSAAVAPPSKSTASKSSSNLARSLPASASPNLLNHGLPMHPWVHSISVSNCISNLAQSRPQSASLSSLNLGLQLHLQTRSITASQCISEFTQSWSPIASPSSRNHGLKLQLWVHSISASKCISKLTRSLPRSVSLSSPNPGLQTHLSTCSITASKYIVNEPRRVYGNTGVTEVDWATGSTYSGDHGVDRHHLIFISSYHKWKIHTLSFPTFGVSRSFRDVVDPRNCMDSHSWVVSYLLTFFLGDGSLQVLLWLCSTTICGQIDRMYIYRDT